jgi:Protein of unknown function (DUF3108)
MTVAQPGGRVPFGPGEELVFKVQSSRFGTIGRAMMRVSADTLRGRDVYLLAFDMAAKVVLFKATDRTRSWVDAADFTTLRYTKRESSPLMKREEDVDVFPEEHRWQTPNGTFLSETHEPLDELSFLYFIRTLPLDSGAVYSFDRHFDPARNPVVISVMSRDTGVIAVEMKVKDPRQSSGVSVIRLSLTDDEYRLPLRLESAMGIGGTMTMTLVRN